MTRLLTLLAAALLVLPSAAQAGRCAFPASGAVKEFRTLEGECSPDPAGKPELEWLPEPTVTPPSFDPAAEIREGPTHTFGAGQVTQGHVVRPKTAGELDRDKDRTPSVIKKAVLKVLCRPENHDRLSDGKMVWTEAQCLAAFRGMLP